MKSLVSKFKKEGFVKLNFFTKKEIENIKIQILKKINTKVKKKIFRLDKIHKLNLNQKEYENLITPSERYLDLKKCINLKKFNLKISEFLKLYWGYKKFHVYWIGSLKKNQIKKDKIGFRIVRPKIVSDSGVEHTDAYSSDFNSFLTLWVPLVGFDKKYTLRYAKGSHLIKHPKSEQLKQKKYNSKKLDIKYVNKFRFVRTQMKKGEVTIHHPNILHGGSRNRGTQTRVSVEIRLFSAKNFIENKVFDKNFYY